MHYEYKFVQKEIAKSTTGADGMMKLLPSTLLIMDKKIGTRLKNNKNVKV